MIGLSKSLVTLHGLKSQIQAFISYQSESQFIKALTDSAIDYVTEMTLKFIDLLAECIFFAAIVLL